MANSLGNQSMVVSADGSQVGKELDKVEAQVVGWATRLKEAVAGVFSFGKYIGEVSGIFDAIGKGFSALKDIGKQSKQATALGIDQEQYAGLVEVLGRAGVAANDAAAVFANLATSINNAALTGRGPLAHMLADLGVDIQEISEMPIDQQFIELADVISKLPSKAQQAALAMNVFGNVDLLPFLQKGRAGLEDFISEAKRNGLILGRDQQKAAEVASKAWAEAWRTLDHGFKAITNGSAAALAPIISAVSPAVQGVSNAFLFLGNVIGKVISTTSEVFEPVFAYVGELLTEFQNFTSGWLSGIQSIRDVTLDVFQSIGHAGVYAIVGVGAAGVASWEVLKFVVDSITEAWSTFFDWVAGAARATWDGLKAVFETIYVWIRSGLEALVSYLSKFVNALVSYLPDKPEWISSLQDELSKLTDYGKEVGDQFTQPFKRAVKTGLGQVDDYFDKIRNKANAAAADLVKPITSTQVANSPFQSIKPLTKGSADAYNYEVRWKYDPDHIQNDPHELQREANQELKKHTQLLENVEKRLDKQGTKLEAA